MFLERAAVDVALICCQTSLQKAWLTPGLLCSRIQVLKPFVFLRFNLSSMAILRSIVLLVLASISGLALSQCNYTLDMLSYLSSGQSDSESATLAGTLNSVTFNLNFTGTGASYPADMMVYLYAPNGTCVVWGGWNIPPTGGCTDIGTGFDSSWPGNWSTTVNGFYTYTLNTGAYGLSGAGEWTVTIVNAWTGAATATYDLDVVFNGVCAGDCFDPLACNFVPNTTLPNNDLCEYAIDLYPNGLYDCDGNCYLDFDGDGVCNALEIPGCQEPYACNYNPDATDPAPPMDPCTYPENFDVDCDGNSLLPQFLTQPQDLTVSCTSIPVPPQMSAQPAPAAVAYQSLFEENCYDLNEDIIPVLQETEFAADCPGESLIERLWTITDCMGRSNTYLQVITVVDNTPPEVFNDLAPISLDCNDPVVFDPIDAEDACGGTILFLGTPEVVTTPGLCDGDYTRTKTTVISDECGNQTTVVQTLVIEDNDPPFWLNQPDQLVVTDNIDAGGFGNPVADDECSDFEVVLNTTYETGDCPLSIVLTRTFIATDECGNESVPWVQTIQEATDLEATVDFTSVSCNGGNNGSAIVTATGGVAPYNLNWGGYNPNALPAGQYTVQVTDANLCNVALPFLITEPGAFTLELTATQPECTIPNSGTIAADVNGGTGEVTIDWGDIDPNAAEAGNYIVTAIDEVGCEAQDIVTVLPADIPEPLELFGDDEVLQGDSAAYYYEYTQGSTYSWTYTGASEEEVAPIFAISLLWDSAGVQTVCVTETNLEGCTGEPVCMEVIVQDDVWNVDELSGSTISAFPNPANESLTIELSESSLGAPFVVVNAFGASVKRGQINQSRQTIQTSDLAVGHYLLKVEGIPPLSFQVLR